MNLQSIRELFESLAPNAVFYDVGEGNTACNVSDPDGSICADLTARLVALGYSLDFTNRIGASRFETYVDGDSFLHVMLHPAIATLRVTYGPSTYLPATELASYERKTKSTITQMQMQMVDNSITCDSVSRRITANHGAPGMSYLLQIADGRFVMIDGGNRDGIVTPAVLNERGDFIASDPIQTEDAKRLYETMCAMLPEGAEKPVVAAWLISHAHGDHMNLACDFLKTYRSQIQVELMAFNFLNIEKDFQAWLANLVNDFRDSAMACSPDVKTWTVHTGQKLLLPDCTIEIICSAEDFICSGHKLGDINDISLAFRITIGKTSFIALGDAYPTTCAFMRDAYRTALVCDILQVSHHGFDGSGTPRGFYESLDPKICLWPCDEFRFRKDRRNLGNAQEGHLFYSHYWLRNTRWVRGEEVGEREHYTASYTTVIDAESTKRINESNE